MTHYHRSPGKMYSILLQLPLATFAKMLLKQNYLQILLSIRVVQSWKGKPISNSVHKKFETTKKIFSFSNGLNSTFPFSIVLSNFLKFCCHCFYVFFERRWWYGLFVRDDVDNSVWSFGWPGDRYMGNKYSLLSTYNYFRLKTSPEPIHLS